MCQDYESDVNAPDLREEPAVWVFSGNGFHLLIHVDLPNDDRSTQFVKGTLAAASKRSTDKAVDVDTTVYNAARIWKLYGTTARKGDEVKRLGRVHRRAMLLKRGFET